MVNAHWLTLYHVIYVTLITMNFLSRQVTSREIFQSITTTQVVVKLPIKFDVYLTHVNKQISFANVIETLLDFVYTILDEFGLIPRL